MRRGKRKRREREGRGGGHSEMGLKGDLVKGMVQRDEGEMRQCVSRKERVEGWSRARAGHGRRAMLRASWERPLVCVGSDAAQKVTRCGGWREERRQCVS